MQQTDFFKCLSDQTRLDILKLVLDKQEVCVCELTAQLDLSQPKISRHLALLRNLSVLQDERRGQWVYYSLNADLPEWAVAVLHQIFVSDDSHQPLDTQHVSITTHCD
nr:metalloregulator ArsR/SmtB family transcription factor [Acinetobacter marinus]